MQKVFSTRLEEAIRARAKALSDVSAEDAWAETLGAWQRTESVDTTIQRARRLSERSFTRYHRRPARARR